MKWDTDYDNGTKKEGAQKEFTPFLFSFSKFLMQLQDSGDENIFVIFAKRHLLEAYFANLWALNTKKKKSEKRFGKSDAFLYCSFTQVPDFFWFPRSFVSKKLREVGNI